MGACASICNLEDDAKPDSYKPLPMPEKKEEEDPENTEEWKHYKHMMQLTFYTFAGYQPWAKITGLYMHQKDLEKFLEIVNIDDPVENVFKLIDTDVTDGRLTMNEWMDYFTNKDINPGIFQIQEHIQDQITWELLVKALTIFEKMDADHSGKLEYGEFRNFGTLIGLNAEETELLWNSMDTNQSGAVDVVELFEWFRMRLHQQRARIVSFRQPSITFTENDSQRLEDKNSTLTIDDVQSSNLK
eukprot:107190_1